MVSLTPGDVGRRVVVRRRLGTEAGRAVYGDVLGVLESWTGGELVVRRADGTAVVVPAADIVAGKPVPPRPPRRVRVDPEELERVCAEGWPPVEREPLGEWTLRAADGFTGRANSVLCTGEPDAPLAHALAKVRQFYHRRGLPARAQVVVGSRWDGELTAAGWRDPRPDLGGVLVQVAAVPEAAARARSSADVVVGAGLDDAWLAVARPDARPGAAVTRVVTGADACLARIGGPPLATGRGVATGRWLGLSLVAVVPEHRRRLLGESVVAALLRWGADRGARWAYLQTTPGHRAAVALYAGLGFSTHHRYRYLYPPDEIPPGPAAPAIPE